MLLQFYVVAGEIILLERGLYYGVQSKTCIGQR